MKDTFIPEWGRKYVCILCSHYHRDHVGPQRECPPTEAEKAKEEKDVQD